MADVNIEWLGGNCPVQAEGTVDGRRFYFRARYESWSMEIHPTATGRYLNWPDDVTSWEHEEHWGEGAYEAGWMPEYVATEMIHKAANMWSAGTAHGEHSTG